MTLKDAIAPNFVAILSYLRELAGGNGRLAERAAIAKAASTLPTRPQQGERWDCSLQTGRN